MPPAPVSFTITSEDGSGNLLNVETSSSPITTFTVADTGSYFYLVNGADSDGVPRAKATSYYIDAVSMAGNNMPLFMGRTDAFCRPPGELSTAFTQGIHPPVGIFWGQTLWIVDGVSNNTIQTEGYDLIAWQQTPSPSLITNITCPELPCQFQSLAGYAGEWALAIGSDWAMSVDISAETTASVVLPEGLPNWSDVAGGRTIDATTGATFVVGPTRTTPVSSYVVEMDTTGDMYTRTLSVPRQAAAATYVDGQGVLVVGGGPASGPGAEFLADSSAAFVELQYPPDQVTGAALVPEATGTKVWRMGGQNPDGTPAPSVVYDIACTEVTGGGDAGTSTTCTPGSLPTALNLESPPGSPVINANGFGFGDNRIVIGEQTDGTMVAWRVSDTGVTSIPQREPRRYATAIGLPNGFAALIGGTHVSDASVAYTLELVAY